MSALPTPPSGLTGLRMGADDYFALGETQERYELIHGVVLMSPSPRPRHTKAILDVLKQLGRFEDSGAAIDIYTETDLQIHNFSVFRPDVCVFSGKPARIPERLTAAPALVVEVLSPGTEALDMITKRDEYEKLGVKEYWIIDPADGRVRAWHRERERLIETLVEGDSLPSRSISGFVLNLGELRRAVGA